MRNISLRFAFQLMFVLFVYSLVNSIWASEKHDEWYEKSDHHGKNKGAHFIKVVDQDTGKSVRGVYVVINNKVRKTSKKGKVKIASPKGERKTITIIYDSGSVQRLVSFHDIKLNQKTTVLPVKNALPVFKQAKFSLSAPFGSVPQGTNWTGLLPQLSSNVSGPRMAMFDGIQVYDNNLQNDDLFSLMLLAFNENGLPFKYGYMLDREPSELEKQYVSLATPYASPMINDVQIFNWQKQADSLNPSSVEDDCEMSFPPYTGCGFFSPGMGIFSWMNVNRKGVNYSTPGVFLPARTAGANPLMLLPDAMIELVGHDDPIGMGGGINFSRHRFLRFQQTPEDVVNLHMPEIIIGQVNETGAEAIDLQYENGILQATWEINNSADDMMDIESMDYASLEYIWIDNVSQTRNIWSHYFMPVSGENKLPLPELPRRDNLPMHPSIAQLNDTTLTVYGSNSVDGFDAAMAIMESGKQPVHVGNNAFQLTRWR